MKTRQMLISLNDSGVVIKRRKKNNKRVSHKKAERLHNKTGRRIGETIGRIVEKIVEMKELIEDRIGKMRD